MPSQQEAVNFLDEIWRPIKGYEKYYEVSNYGRVKSLFFRNRHGSIYRAKFLKPRNICGYGQVRLCIYRTDAQILIHRLVAESFIPNPDNKPFVNHKDFNKMNNCVENLEWVTCQENVDHAVKGGRYRIGQQGHHNQHLRGASHYKTKLTEDNIRYIRFLKKTYPSISFVTIGDMFNVTRVNIYNIVHHRTWKHIS